MLPDAAPGPEAILHQSEESRDLHTVLAKLKPEDRAVIILRYWYEMSEDEIAQTVNSTVSAVKSRLHRARRMIAQQYQVPEAIRAHGGNSYEPSAL